MHQRFRRWRTNLGEEAIIEKGKAEAAKNHEVEFELARKDPNKFVFFPKLLIELRKDSWELARPEPRFIKLDMTSDLTTVYSPAKVPALLQACHESREIALKWYKLFFPPRYRNRKQRGGEVGKAQTYFDATADEILGTMQLHSELEQTQKLVWEGRPWYFQPRLTPKYFPAIKELIIVNEDIQTRAELKPDNLIDSDRHGWTCQILLDRREPKTAEPK